jgi:lipoprotein-anchoring transpeptidase ErfK/SrfK
LLSLVVLNGQVVQASQRVEEKSESATRNLRGARAGPPPLVAREIGYAHVEVDLSRQRLSVVDGFGRVVKTLPVSSGSGKWFTSEGRTRRAITPRGRFIVDRKIAGWHKSPLGMLYYPIYINQGVAIHGSLSVPPRPASHGCIRIPMSAAKEFFVVTPFGTVVLVY